MRVLGIEVERELLARWCEWLMPAVQPFVVGREIAARHGWADDRARLSFELRDSFRLYDVPVEMALVWLSRSEAMRLPAGVRRAQPAAHRWPTRDPARDLHQVVRYVEAGWRASRHDELTRRDWQAAHRVVPGARDLAGRFPACSGPNCFGSVMAAAGISSAQGQWMQIDPFERWLAQATRPGGDDQQPGTVLLWRDPTGRPAHAAITLGNGWLLHKPSQGWMSPIKILTVNEGKNSVRMPGRRLTRRHLA